MTDVLVVCTLNMARSPLLERMLQHDADVRLGTGAVQVASAGTQADVGYPAADAAQKLAADRGLSLDDHLTRPLFYLPVDEVPLIITMSHAHRQQLMEVDEDRGSRTFLLREMLSLLPRSNDMMMRSLPSARSDPRERLRAVAATLHAQRPAKLKRRRADVPDPMGGKVSSFKAVGQEFDEAAATLSDVLFGSGRTEPDER